MEMEEDPRYQHLHLPHIGICALGKTRWYWMVATSWFAWSRAGFDGESRARVLIGSGYAPDKSAAEHAARAVAGEDARGFRAGWAAEYHREIAAQRRAEKAARNPSKDTGAAPVEFVYEMHDTHWDGIYHDGPRWDWTAHQIVKRTKTRIYVERRPGETDRLIVLDRAVFERDGHAKHGRKWWRPTYYAEPQRHWNDAVVPSPGSAMERCLTVLGLDGATTRDEIERAYRIRAREVHPDSGGSHEAFLNLQGAYETALRLVRVAA